MQKTIPDHKKKKKTEGNRLIVRIPKKYIPIILHERMLIYTRYLVLIALHIAIHITSKVLYILLIVIATAAKNTDLLSGIRYFRDGSSHFLPMRGAQHQPSTSRQQSTRTNAKVRVHFRIAPGKNTTRAW